MSPEQQGPCWPPLGCPAAPNGKKARHFPPQGHTRGFVRELRDARLGWWGGEAGESHLRQETCVFRLVVVRNSNSNCRPQPRGVSDIHWPGAVERGDIRFQGSPENARLVSRKWTSIRGPLGMRPPVPLAPHKIMRGPFLASIGSFLRDSATKSQTAAGDVG